MAELKAGGLALIIKSRFPENIGKAVRTDRFIGVSEPYFVDSWLVTALSPLAGTLGQAKEGDPMVAPVFSLMPIDGDDFQREHEESHPFKIAHRKAVECMREKLKDLHLNG